MKRVSRSLGLVILIVLCLSTGLSGGIVLDRWAISQNVAPGSATLPTGALPDSTPSEVVSEFGLMYEAWNTIQQNYVDRPAVEPETLTYGAIAGMVNALGDTGHSRFLTSEEVKQEHTLTSGEFEGIGVYVEMKDGHVVIVAPIDGTPAQQAGLRAGDVILKVDGENVTGLTMDEVVSRVLGPAGTSVTLTILTPDSGQTRDVTLTRARITLNNVIWQRIPGTSVAHLRIVTFSKGVTDDLKQALSEIQSQGMTALILDLRNNPGGLLNEAIGVASQFLADGNVLLVQDAQGELKPVPVEKGGNAYNLPMVLLVNQGTASAAEIVSGALQDTGRARLVGETTFGTGTVLNEFKLSDGSALLLATEEWLTPNGRLIWHQGIAPDRLVPLPPTAELLLPEMEIGMTQDQFHATSDVQLLRALELLDQPAE